MQRRIDSQPTHSYQGFQLRIGRPMPYGANQVPGGINFSIFSRHATSCILVLFEYGNPEPRVEIPFPEEFRIGHIFTMVVFGLNIEEIEYGYRFDGPHLPHEGHRFNPHRILLDPYARAIGGRDVWGQVPIGRTWDHHPARIVPDDYDWEDDRPPQIPIEDLIIYEMHVRGFTRHPSSNVKYPGTFAALREKIPYLKELGVNCIELMPIFEFDEFEYERVNPFTGSRLMNYWGYSTIGFFAPKAGYAATGRYGMQVDELKTLIKELHRNGIEIILDVVFNHTAEGDERGPTISFRGIDNKTYYMLSPDGRYLNFSGTGNTMNCNNPVVRSLVIHSLRYWVSEYHIDGFRFDLASILGRDQEGNPLANPPLIEALAHDPVLANAKLIAEAWDAGGMYQVGSFPAYGRWAEWNGKYRDTLRKWLRGDAGLAWEVAERIQGSPDLYWDRGASASINFITAHDGFTLRDLFTYNEKHNEANAEDNRDGTDSNYSWNCGIEGETYDQATNDLRRRLIKNALGILLLSRGVPMFLMGDEMGRTQGGNNNMYCHDTPENWLNWEYLKEFEDIHIFARYCVEFRHAHPVLRSRAHFCHEDRVGSGYPDISWHSTNAWKPDWGEHSRTLAFMLDGQHAMSGAYNDDSLYVAMNMHWEQHQFEIPALPTKLRWHLFINTSPGANPSIHKPGTEPSIKDQRYILVGPRSIVVLCGR